MNNREKENWERAPALDNTTTRRTVTDVHTVQHATQPENVSLIIGASFGQSGTEDFRKRGKVQLHAMVRTVHGQLNIILNRIFISHS